ncbi:UNVERIFIED_CONTAM: hypothetical protein Sradi_6834100 [Sesamum radiatum]|uniref:Uncharacterized protein n=1 Tax=Sesamum radiatum TaxID=300843 RepID=A0AAW2JLR5_SESRA
MGMTVHGQLVRHHSFDEGDTNFALRLMLPSPGIEHSAALFGDAPIGLAIEGYVSPVGS